MTDGEITPATEQNGKIGQGVPNLDPATKEAHSPRTVQVLGMDDTMG